MMRFSKASLVCFMHVALGGGSVTAFSPPRSLATSRPTATPLGSVTSTRVFSTLEAEETELDETTTFLVEGISRETPVEEIDIDSVVVPDLKLLEEVQPFTHVPLVEITETLLNREQHPPGTLSQDIVESASNVIWAWSRTSSVSGALAAEQILERLHEEYQQGNEDAILTSKLFSMAIGAWTRSGHREAPSRATRLLGQMEDWVGVHPELDLNRFTYGAVLFAWHKAGDTERVQEFFAQMQGMMEVDTQNYNVLLQSLASTGDARKAEEVLGEMIQKCNTEEGSSDGCISAPDLLSYNSVLTAWSKSGEKGAAQRADTILSTMESQYDNGESNIHPDVASYANVVHTWVQGREPDAVQYAQDTLERARSRSVTPDTYMYNVVLAAWSVSNARDAPDRAQELLYEMERAGHVNNVSYVTVITAWKNSGRRDAAAQAEQLLMRMEQLHKTDPNVDVKPDVIVYSAVIACLAKSKSDGSADKAEGYLQRMFDMSRKGDTGLAPNVQTINGVLDALAKSGRKGAAERAERLLVQMENSPEGSKMRPTTISYSTVIQAHALRKEPESAQRAEEIFQRMENAYEGGNVNAKPNTWAFDALIDAWVKTGNVESLQRAEAILRRMESLYEQGDDCIRPTTFSYSMIMNGWAKSGAPDALHKVERTFDRMKAMYESGNSYARPNVCSFVTLLDATVRSGGRRIPQRAEAILNSAFSEYRNGNVNAKPNTIFMNSVMNCWSKSYLPQAGKKAQAILDLLVDLYEAEKDNSLEPNGISFLNVINSWAVSRTSGKSVRARAVLQKMIDMYEAGTIRAKPNIPVYTCVLKACAHEMSDERETAVQIADSTFRELCETPACGQPNHLVYGTYLMACRNLMPPGDARTSKIEAAFARCCSDGQVDRFVVEQVLRLDLDKQQLRNIFQSAVSEDGFVSYDELPAEWKRNVEAKKSKVGR